jgi:hypothetical protein
MKEFDMFDCAFHWLSRGESLRRNLILWEYRWTMKMKYANKMSLKDFCKLKKYDYDKFFKNSKSYII